MKAEKLYYTALIGYSWYEGVQITINGEAKAKYMGTVDLSQPLKENLELVAADALTAFAGVDPGVNESGSYAQKSVPTSKRGSSNLRKTLFQVMDVLIKTMSRPIAGLQAISTIR